MQGTHQSQADEPPHTLHVSSGAGHQVSRLLGVVEGEAQVLEVIVDGASQVVGHFLRYVFRHVGLEIGKDGARQGEGDNRGSQQDKETESVLLEDLVDGVSQEPGHGQGEQGGHDQGKIGQSKVFLIGS